MRAFLLPLLIALVWTTPVAAQAQRPPVVVTPPAPQALPNAAPGVSRVWALPALELPASGLNCIYITNMSLTPARITARVIGQNGGSHADANALYNRQLGEFLPGHQRHACWTSDSRSVFPEDAISYWLIISSTVPVAITAFSSSSHVLVETVTGGYSSSDFNVRTPLPVDCARPAGYEFICSVTVVPPR